MLRFWESRFSQISPMKKGGGRRYYRPEDITFLSGIRALLYDDGLSIKNVQAHIKANGISAICARSEERAPVHDGQTEVVSPQTVLMPESEDVETSEQNTVVNTPAEGTQNSETHDRLSGALQKLMDARERLNETLE